MIAEARTAAVRKARERLLSDVEATDAEVGDVRRVVAVAASSRGGSSLLFSLLRSTGAFVSLDGEHTHLYRLYGLAGSPRTAHGDGWIPQDGDVAGFLQALIAEAGTVTGGTDRLGSGRNREGRTLREFPFRLAVRLLGQWPSLESCADEIVTVAKDVVASRRDHAFDPEACLLEVLRRLAASGCAVDAGYYDLTDRPLRSSAPEGPPPGAPPIIEEPPFVVPAPVHPATAADLRSKPLLLKASVDAYRLPWLAEVFPDAHIRIVHLVRNPAAAVNGLIDGWLDRGFFSHDVSPVRQLAIRGYSQLPWGSAWWNFDLPPGWASVADRPLPEVCAFQWRTAHAAILDDQAVGGLSVLRVQAEDVLLGGAARERALAAILHFAGVTDAPHRPVVSPRPVMATATPRAGRWRDRAAVLEPVLTDPAIRDMARRLGCGEEHATWI